jgi:large conductance mechanosensitive channel
MRTFFEEFKKFAVKGNVTELAIAVVIGASFTKIVSSLVDNIITPLLGLIVGGVKVSGLMFRVGNAEITYGVFFQAVIDFLIVAFVIFIVIKMINRLQEAGEPTIVEKSSEPKEEVKLLREIRDSLNGDRSI